jgi:hypothetical protein
MPCSDVHRDTLARELAVTHYQSAHGKATRAPSVHNTQPWRFRVSPDVVQLWSDPRRKLRAEPSGREMLISCRAALFGLRLAVRSLGYLLPGALPGGCRSATSTSAGASPACLLAGHRRPPQPCC